MSECSNVCTDLWVNGHRKVVLDTQIKLAYDEPTYERLHEMRPPRYPDLYKVDREIERVVEAPRTVETSRGGAALLLGRSLGRPAGGPGAA